MDRKPVLLTEHICKLCSWNVRTMVPVIANPLVGLHLVLRDEKVMFKGSFCGYEESFQDHDTRATMGTRCHHTRDPKGEGKFRGEA